MIQDYIRWIRKGLVALAAALGVLAFALTEASQGGTSLTLAEIVEIALAFLGALGVIAVPNGPKPETDPKHKK